MTEEIKNSETELYSDVIPDNTIDKYGFDIYEDDDDPYAIYGIIPQCKKEMLGTEKWLVEEFKKLEANEVEYSKTEFEFPEEYIAKYINGLIELSEEEMTKKQLLCEAAGIIKELIDMQLNSRLKIERYE